MLWQSAYIYECLAVDNPVPKAHGLRNEVALWRELAPQPLSFTPRPRMVDPIDLCLGPPNMELFLYFSGQFPRVYPVFYRGSIWPNVGNDWRHFPCFFMEQFLRLVGNDMGVTGIVAKWPFPLLL